MKKDVFNKKISAIPTQDFSSLQVTKYSIYSFFFPENLEVCD